MSPSSCCRAEHFLQETQKPAANERFHRLVFPSVITLLVSSDQLSFLSVESALDTPGPSVRPLSSVLPLNFGCR